MQGTSSKFGYINDVNKHCLSFQEDLGPNDSMGFGTSSVALLCMLREGQLRDSEKVMKITIQGV